MAGGGGHPLAGKDALHRRPDHLVHEAFRSSAVSFYPHQPLPFTPRSTIHRSSRERHHEEEVFPPGIDFATKAISQECSPGCNLQDPLFHSSPRPCYALPTAWNTRFLGLGKERQSAIIGRSTSVDKSRSCPADVFAKGRGPQKPSGVCLAHGNTERFPSHLPPAASLVRPTPSMQSPSYPHAVALEDIVPVERWGVQRVNRRWVLHRAGKCRRAGTQTLRDLFTRSKEAQGTGTRQEGRQLAATNRSTKKGRT